MADIARTSTRPGLILISIASYRDHLLVPTVRDCLQKARNPERLRFGICWQHASDEELPDWFCGDQFRVLDVDYRESGGACWARAKIMELYDGEDWYLQLDSHHRFAPNWDAVLLDDAARTDTDRFVLTSYAPPFAATKQETLTQLPMSMQFKEFTVGGILLMKPSFVADWEQRTRLHRSRFVSAHLLFAPGRFVRDVPYDPELYFDGEEITLAVRAFTHGYDLFEPSRVIVWHEVTYAYRRRHWDDHLGDDGPPWYERDAVSHTKVRRLFDEASVGPLGLGTERSLEEYEAYAGISFRHRKVQDYTRQSLEPPNPPAEKGWFQQVQKHHVDITADLSQLPAKAVDDDVFWHVGVHDDQGRELHTRHATRAEFAEQLVQGRPITLTAQFESQAHPATWTVIPHSETEGWLPPLSGTIDGDECVDVHARRPARVPGITWESAGDCHFATLAGSAPRRHELNSSGALLVELADGRHSVREIATYLRHTHQFVDDPVTEILDFYEIARSAGLVTIEEF